MMKIRKTAVLALTLAMLVTGCAGGKTVLEVGKYKVSEDDVKFMTERYNTQIGDFQTAKDYAMQAFEDAILIYEVSKAEGIELDEETEKEFKSSRASYMANFGGKTAYEKYVKENNINAEIFDLILAQDYYRPLLEEKLASEEASDDELKQYMQDNYYRAKHVLINCMDEAYYDEKKAEAQSVYDKAKAGEDFDKLVEEKSEDPGSATYKDGYVFTEGDMVQSFEDGVKSIQPGEYTMVESNYGFHVIKRLALDPSDEKFQSLFDENKESIKAGYVKAKFDEKLKEIAEANKIEVKLNEEALANVTEPTPEPTEDPKEDPAYDGSTPEPDKE